MAKNKAYYSYSKDLDLYGCRDFDMFGDNTVGLMVAEEVFEPKVMFAAVGAEPPPLAPPLPVHEPVMVRAWVQVKAICLKPVYAVRDAYRNLAQYAKFKF